MRRTAVIANTFNLPEDGDCGRDEVLGSNHGFAQHDRLHLDLELRHQVAHARHLVALLVREVAHALARIRGRVDEVQQGALLAHDDTLGLQA